MAPATAATHANLQALNPDGVGSGAMPSPPVPPVRAIELQPEVFMKVFTKPP